MKLNSLQRVFTLEKVQFFFLLQSTIVLKAGKTPDDQIYSNTCI
jgi:hypothetical protein